MNAEQAKQLREQFPAEAVGKLPRANCKDCSKAQDKVCSRHSKTKCAECGNYMTTAHIHLDYVGHAAVTDRLLKVDPGWTWRFLAANPDGSPVVVMSGLSDPVAKVGIWIELVIGETATPGFGEGKGFKDAIGDAIRNAAMRRGVALDLWAKEDLHAAQGAEDRAREAQEENARLDALTERLVAAVDKPEDEPELRAKVAGHRAKGTVESHAAWLTKCIEAAEAKSSAGSTEPQADADAGASPVSQAVWGEPGSTPADGPEGDGASSGPSPFAPPAGVPVQKPASAAQKKALNALIGRVREQARRVTTAELWAFVGRTPDTPEDGEHFAPLREALTLHEASELIEHLKALEEFAVADGALEPRRAA